MFGPADLYYQCEQRVSRRQAQDDKIIFIVSGMLGREAILITDDLPEISAIYVYCRDKQTHEIWASKYRKVCSALTSPDELAKNISADQNARERTNAMTSKPISIYDSNSS
ncbi:unnamed protein product [Didymodactylos carnosus]|uniref:Uncharacterized protein n=1 Tax=Didymodactylos carnosus TaxID=1234261 RepID=A0A814W1B0_9BILA|nr:unnamed protein product [Didymodactylos carnosus]CAF3956964.1 unnamed protein product [Didymodactylos carnosus]